MASLTLNNRALLHKEALAAPVQHLFDQDLRLARDVVKESKEAEVINYWIQKNNQGRATKKTPGPFSLGQDSWPEVTIDELNQNTVRIKGKALKVRATASQLEFSTGNVDIQDAVDLAIRGWAEMFESEAFDTYTSSRTTAHGSEFDSHLSQATGGYATTGGHVVIDIDTGSEFNKGGDAIQTLREALTVWHQQNRIKQGQSSSDGEVRLSPNIVAYTDGLTFGALHDQLRLHGITPQIGQVPKSIVIPDLYGVEFVQADFAIQNNGDILFVDRGNQPVVGYYHEYQRLRDVGFASLASESGFPLQVRDKDEDNGDAIVAMASGYVYALRKPKYVMLMKDAYTTV